MRAPLFLACFLGGWWMTDTLAQTTAETSRGAALAAYDRLLSEVAPGQTTVTMGDMIVPVAVVRTWRNRIAGESQRGIRSAAANVALWTSGDVFYTFNTNVSAAHRQHFLDAAAEWSTFADLTFSARTTQPNYIVVNEDPNISGGNSAIGMIGGPQALNIGATSFNRGTLLHEIGHALGLVHEHQRSDRDGFVTIFPANIPGGASDLNYVLIPNSNNLGAYDFLSVMHYARDTLTTNPGQDTMQPKPAFAAFFDIMGRTFRDRFLSRADRVGMAALYGAGPALGLVVTRTMDSGPGTLRAALYRAFDLATDSPLAMPTITFQIPTSDPGFAAGVFTIRPTDRLPGLGSRVLIDATTQTTFTGNTNANGPEIVLNGAAVATPDSFGRGLWLPEQGSTVRGLVINGFGTQGVLITGSGNAVEGCFIGTTASGASAVPNAFPGVEINAGATGNRVGGTLVAQRNVVSGNSAPGVAIQGPGTSGNAVRGNFIGLNATGAASLGNGFGGVQIYGGATGNVVGGAENGARNVISGNPTSGLSISGAATTQNVIAGNWIGLNGAGTAAVPNTFAGVTLFDGATGNTIGGGNVISGNSSQGVLIIDDGTDANVIAGNFIGLNPAGTAAIPNAFAGVQIFGGADNMIGGFAAAARNVISGNASQGVALDGAATQFNRIVGNYLGTNAAGTAAVPNAFPGVEIYGGANANEIGGSEAGAGNVISGNGFRGITLSGAGTNANVIAGNLIGLNAAGMNALPNDGPGVVVFGGPQSNTIGGTSGGRNFIAGNSADGVMLIDPTTTANVVVGNSIGRTPSGTALGNGGIGVVLFGGAQGNFIGGAMAGAANSIAHNAGSGIGIFDNATVANRISGNSIFANSGIAIDLSGGSGPGSGVTSNDAGDADTGPNGLQNFPVLTSAVLGLGTTVTGTLNSTASTTFRLEFFATGMPDASGFGEAQTFVGAFNVTTNSSGNASFSTTLSAVVPAGQRLSATATSAAGNTSELAANVIVTTTDTDGDGLPNSYETANGLSTSVADAALDTDGDGENNGDEFRAGTDPRSSASVFRPPAIALTAGAPALSLATQPGRTYRVEFADSLLPPISWRTLVEQVAGTGGGVPFTDPGAIGLPRRFYRARVEP